MKDLTHKIVQFFSGEDFAEHGDDARLELTPAELRQICKLMTENARLKTELDFIEKETTLYMLRKKEYLDKCKDDNPCDTNPFDDSRFGG